MACSSALLDCVAMLVEDFSGLQPLSDYERIPAHQPTALSSFFAEPTITSLFPLDAHSVPQVPPSQLWVIKGSPTAATWGMGVPGPRQRQGLPRESPTGIPLPALVPSLVPSIVPLGSAVALLCSCMKAPSSVCHEYGQPRNDHRVNPSSFKRKSFKKELLH